MILYILAKLAALYYSQLTAYSFEFAFFLYTSLLVRVRELFRAFIETKFTLIHLHSALFISGLRGAGKLNFLTSPRLLARDYKPEIFVYRGKKPNG